MEEKISNEVLAERLNNTIQKMEELSNDFKKFLERKENERFTMLTAIFTGVAGFVTSIIVGIMAFFTTK